VTKYARKVHLLVRGERMRASRTMQDRVLQHSKIEVHMNTGVVDAYGDDTKGLRGVTLVDTRTQEQRDLPVRGLFYGIGHQPNSSLVEGQVELDDAGCAILHSCCCASRAATSDQLQLLQRPQQRCNAQPSRRLDLRCTA
jgi:thioredoxin reductase (NADPH)